MRFAVLLIASIFLPLLSGCGGGSTQVAEGGVGGTGISMGKVSGFGSLIVNDVKYEIGNADFVKVSASEKEELKAVVDLVSVDENTFSMLGQVIKVTASTIYEDERDGDKYFNLERLVAGDYVEVDLYEQQDGALVASKLERDSFDSLAEIEGVLDSVDNDTIRVVNIPVNVSALTNFNPKIGQRVEIKGTYDDLEGVLTATSGEIEAHMMTEPRGG